MGAADEGGLTPPLTPPVTPGAGAEHDHAEFVEGCARCDLSRAELGEEPTDAELAGNAEHVPTDDELAGTADAEPDPPVYDERGNVRPRGTPGARPMTFAERKAIAKRIQNGDQPARRGRR